MRPPRRSTQEHPPDLPTLMPPDPVDRARPVDVPDEGRMQVALHRALRYHLQRVRDAEGVDYAAMHGEIPIDALIRAFPFEVGGGWWRIGSVYDSHDGLSHSLPVLWHPETDRVRIGRIPPPPAPPPLAAPRPITMDGNYRLHVADGWRYWHEGRAYTAEEARAVLCQPGVHAYDGWSWERVADENPTETP